MRFLNMYAQFFVFIVIMFVRMYNYWINNIFCRLDRVYKIIRLDIGSVLLSQVVVSSINANNAQFF